MNIDENKGGRPAKRKGSPFTAIFLSLVKNSTQQEIADKIGVSRQNVGKWISKATTPDIETLCKIADAYGVSTDYLLGRTDTKSTDANVKAAHDFTGLSEDALCILRKNNKNTLLGGRYVDMVNYVLCSPKFDELIYRLISINEKSGGVKEYPFLLDFPYNLAESLNADMNDVDHFFNDQRWTLINELAEYTAAENSQCDVERYKVMKIGEDLCNCFDVREYKSEPEKVKEALISLGVTKEEIEDLCQKGADNNGINNPTEEQKR